MPNERTLPEILKIDPKNLELVRDATIVQAIMALNIEIHNLAKDHERSQEALYSAYQRFETITALVSKIGEAVFPSDAQ